MRAGHKPDAIHGQRGKQRSVHNTYFGLPVLIAMLSNHYGMLHQHSHNWVVLCVLMAAAVAIRIFFVKRHKGRQQLGRAGAGLGVVGRAHRVDGAEAATGCRGCRRRHAGHAGAGAGHRPHRAVWPATVAKRHKRACDWTSAEALTAHKAQIYQQVVVQRAMPLNNATGLTRG